MLKVQTYKTKYRKNFFCLRIRNIWNKLPHYVVNASSLNSFKNLLDRYYIISNMYYDYLFIYTTHLYSALFTNKYALMRYYIFKPEAEQHLLNKDSSDYIGREG